MNQRHIHTHCIILIMLIMLGALVMGCATTKIKENDTSKPLIKNRNVDTPAPSLSQEAKTFVSEGDRALSQKNYAAAAKSYAKASAIAPHWQIFLNQAIALAKSHSFEESIKSMRLAVEHGGKNKHTVWFNLGNIYQNRGMYEEAIDAYRVAISLSQGPDFESILNISSALLFVQRYDEARATAEKLIELNPKDPRAYHNLALIPQMQKNYPKALEAYERVHEVDPNFAQAYYNKADALGSGMKRYSQSIKAFEKYIELAPNGPYITRAKRYIQNYRSMLQGS